MSAQIPQPDHVSVEPVPRLSLRPTEAARAMGIGERLLSTLIADKTSGLPVVRVGRAVLIPTDALKAWLADQVDGRGG